MLGLYGVGKRYPGRPPVLTGVDLALHAGEVVAVIGGNGSGKSTLLRIVARLSRPSTGVVRGRPVTGYLPDRFPAGTRMKALAYLRHLGRIRGLSTAETTARALPLLDRLALAGGASTPLRELSKGNAQKVGLVQALLADPELLVVDEPFSGLDPDAHAVFGELVAEARDRGAAVVFTEHRPEVAAGLATTTVRLTGGRLVPVDVEPSEGPLARILLAATAADAWQAEPGVLAARDRDGLVELTVPAARCDALLLVALRRGCSVHAVRREAEVALA
ncbi:ATP-binding cassette domain-containing protein [Amycolatopsis arida]|uniref:ATP-binding cassette domain-containing protein n=1 Tax=Amycolatopsis arida TaxID=587909 RepID=UPI003C7C832A